MVGINDSTGWWLTILDRHVECVKEVESWALSIDQPTIFLEKVSITAQQ